MPIPNTLDGGVQILTTYKFLHEVAPTVLQSLHKINENKEERKRILSEIERIDAAVGTAWHTNSRTGSS